MHIHIIQNTKNSVEPLNNIIMKYLLSILSLISVSTTSLAQTYVDSQKKIINNSALESSNEQLNIIQSENTFYSKSVIPTLGNLVFIEQVGFNNIGSVSVASDQSEVNLLQVGSNNQAFINLSAVIIRENVSQIGNDNLFKDFSVHGAQIHTADVLQEGSYNEIIRTGSNSISQKIKITQNGIGRRAYIIHN
jgi:hypothetical protein